MIRQILEFITEAQLETRESFSRKMGQAGWELHHKIEPEPDSVGRSTDWWKERTSESWVYVEAWFPNGEIIDVELDMYPESFEEEKQRKLFATDLSAHYARRYYPPINFKAVMDDFRITLADWSVS